MIRRLLPGARVDAHAPKRTRDPDANHGCPPKRPVISVAENACSSAPAWCRTTGETRGETKGSRRSRGERRPPTRSDVDRVAARRREPFARPGRRRRSSCLPPRDGVATCARRAPCDSRGRRRCHRMSFRFAPSSRGGRRRLSRSSSMDLVRSSLIGMRALRLRPMSRSRCVTHSRSMDRGRPS